jgi:hypothetical protein
LPVDVALDVIKLAKQRKGISVTAYCGERILAEDLDEQTSRLAFYREPDVEAVGPLDVALTVGSGIRVHKMIFMGEQGLIDSLRPCAEELLAGRASLTTALEGMLEVLPQGASKGRGVAWLLNYLGEFARTSQEMVFSIIERLPTKLTVQYNIYDFICSEQEI